MTVEQIRVLPDGAEIVVTWDGGNGPHPYRVLVDEWGVRRIEGVYCDQILPATVGRNPIHRVTAGWDEATRAWDAQRLPLPEHLQEKVRRLRGAGSYQQGAGGVVPADRFEEEVVDRREQIAEVLREFHWDNYGLDQVDIGLHDYPDRQEWVDALAGEIDGKLGPAGE